MAPRSSVSVTVAILMATLCVAPAGAFDTDFPFLGKKADDAGNVEVPVVKPVDPNAPFPQLPPVQAMLNGSDHTVSAIEAEVTKIQARVRNLETRDQSRLAQKKAEFEANLKSQEEETRSVIAHNSQIAARIGALKKQNEALRQSAKSLKDGNHEMREELRSVAAKIGVSGDFVQTSLKVTDDKKAKALAVLSAGRRNTPKVEVPAADDADSDAATASPNSRDDGARATEDHGDDSEDADAAGDVAQDANTKPALLHHHAKLHKLFGKAGTESGVKAVSKTTKRHGEASGKTAANGNDDDDDDKDDKDDDDDDKDDKDDDKDDGPDSFLEMEAETEEESGSEDNDEEATVETKRVLPWKHASRHHRHNAEVKTPDVDGPSKALLQSVSQELKDLALEDQEGMDEQTRLYREDSSNEHKAFETALSQQRALNKTESSLLVLENRLKGAVSHLETTRNHLEQRLRGLGQYLQHLAHLLLAPPNEARSLIEQMPQNVDIPPPVAANSSTMFTATSLIQRTAR